VHSVEELKLLVHESQAEGVLEETQEAMLVRVFEFGERYVTETMIPRTDIVGIPADATVGDLLQVFNTAQHSRFPVYEEDLDRITGIVAIKDVLLALAEGPHNRARTLVELDLVHPAFSVPDSRKIGDLFSEMREQKVGMAIVIDEYGGTAGLVTLEELIEEVVGRVTDDWVVEPASVQAVSEGVFEVSAQTRIDEINEELDLSLPERDEYETLAGFLLYLFRRIPEPGAEMTWEGLHFTILQMKGPKIEQVRITRA
jgi:putative hemolysin